MGDDVEVLNVQSSVGRDILVGAPPRIAARLCNLPTGKSSLLPQHQRWLDEKFKPEVLSLRDPSVVVRGYASRLGDGGANALLSRQRATTAQQWVARYGGNITFQVHARGETESGPDQKNDDGRYRCVEVLLYGNPTHAFVQQSIINTHRIVKRSQWGAAAPKKQLDPDWDYHSLVIHHSGNTGLKDPKAIQNLHFSEGYDDVGYHYMIHPSGTIYEGREIVFKGAHVKSDNTRRLGILMMGDFDEQWWDEDDDLSAIHLAVLRRLIATLKRSFPIRYLGGHLEFAATTGRDRTCPGNLLIQEMPKLRQEFSLAAPSK